MALGWRQNGEDGLGWRQQSKKLDTAENPGDTSPIRTEGNSRMSRLVKVQSRSGEVLMDYDELVAKDPEIAEHVYGLFGDDDPENAHLQQFADMFCLKFQLEHREPPV